MAELAPVESGFDLNQVAEELRREERSLLPRIRVPYRTTDEATHTTDSFQNFQLQLGMGTDNALSGSTYGFNPITRNRTLLEWIHRGSWLGGVAIDLVADDMTKAGIDISSTMSPDDIQDLDSADITSNLWGAINDAVKWSRLYGGSLAVIMIDGQNYSDPLDPDRVGRNSYKGVVALDRWMVEPSYNELVDQPGPYLGMPKFYRVNAQASVLSGQRIHYSRCIKFIGIKLPYWQSVMENMWGISVLERLYDRMVGFDSATQGLAQSAYKSFIRIYKIKGLRRTIAGPPEALAQLVAFVQMMRKYQSIEGITLIDEEDSYEGHQHSMAGMSDVLMQLGQQLAGALQIPLVRLFGMSPAGFSATGESDLRTYYDGINQKQEKDLRVGLLKIKKIQARSEGIRLPDNFNFIFKPLWQVTEEQKASISSATTASVVQVKDAGIVGPDIALKELRQLSKITGVWSNITDEDIEEAKNMPPPGMEGMGGGLEPPMPGQMGQQEQPPGLQGEPSYEEPEAPVGTPKEEDDEQSRLKPGNTTHIHIPHEPRLRLIGRDHAAPIGAHISGLDVQLKNPRGTARYGKNWSVIVPADYGFIRNTNGADGDQIDCYVGPNRDSSDVWVIDQINSESGAFDEHKCMLGFKNQSDALKTYVRGFSDGKGLDRLGSISRISIEDFRGWLVTGHLKKPFSDDLKEAS